MAEEGMWGLSSLRDERFRLVARHCKGRVLDVGCGRGNLFVRDHLDAASGSIGVDVFPYDGVECVVEDPLHLPFDNASFDTITLIAVGGHIPQDKRAEEFKEVSRVLKPGGLLLFTEGEPLSQTFSHLWRHYLYKLVGKTDMDSERGMVEGEQYCMPCAEIKRYLNTSPLQLITRKKFMWGLNTLYICQKLPAS